jgi:SAM-dependent methyltransferase
MPTHAAFWDRIAEKYARSPIKNMPAYEASLARTRTYLKDTDNVLELGAGTGSTALLLAENVAHLTSTDLSPKMMEIAERKRVAAKVDNVTFKSAEIAEVEGTFDAVLAFNLLHLVPDLPAALADIHARTKPGGHFISKSVCLGDGGWYFRPLIAVMRAVGYAPPVNIFGIAALEDAIAEAGFDIIETGNYPVSPPSRFVVARRLA